MLISQNVKLLMFNYLLNFKLRSLPNCAGEILKGCFPSKNVPNVLRPHYASEI